jgi:predicted enzyme related to lactoylglutathione lyase
MRERLHMTARVLVNIDVPELSPAIEFYESAVGASVTRVLDDDVAELAYGSSQLFLLAKAAGSVATAAGQRRERGRHWTPVHVDFVVDDINVAVERAVAAGAKRESECVEWRGSKCVSFSDPFGHGFCLLEFSANGYE